ncbi:GDSL-type esterase/lipase family protein [Clostridium rectalis]|uniref:GDSL-type esterase/lipase family protein n=1 Tax=Clostridium rectalis TaxID=2040295 RepID=UPI000F634C0B|nr:GDSL-type esterase/lipase family protein [Clostridium rectalis]
MNSKIKREKRIKFKPKKFLFSSTILILIILVICNSTEKLFYKKVTPNNSTAYAVSKNTNSTGFSQKSRETLSKNNNKLENPPSKENTQLNDGLNTFTKDEHNKTNMDIPLNKNLFKTSLFIGDSMTEGLYFYELLNEENVSGFKGYTVAKAKKNIDKILKINAKNIFILLGSNDIEYEMSSSKFCKDYGNLIDMIKNRLPNAKIYIQSITPVTEKAVKKQPLFSKDNINKFNTSLKNLATEKNVTYLNITSILVNNQDNLYEPDGIHLTAKFHNLWLKFLQKYVK